MKRFWIILLFTSACCAQIVGGNIVLGGNIVIGPGPAGSPPPPPGTYDMLSLMLMKPSLRAVDHFAGTKLNLSASNHLYTQLTTGNYYDIKGDSGYPWDINLYDANYIYLSTTEYTYASASEGKRFESLNGAIGFKGVPFAARFMNIGQSVLSNDSRLALYTACGTATYTNLGYVKVTLTGPYVETIPGAGSNLPSNLNTVHLEYEWDLAAGYTHQSASVKETFTFDASGTYGLVAWKTQDWDTGTGAYDSPTDATYYNILTAGVTGIPYSDPCNFGLDGGPPSYISRTDLTTITLPTVPPSMGTNVCSAGSLTSCGNLTGANTMAIDPNFLNPLYRIVDTTTNDPTTAHPYSSNAVSCSGSGEDEIFSFDSSMITVCNESGGFFFPMNFGPPFGVASTRMYTTTDSATHGFEFTTQGLMGWGMTLAHNHLLYVLNSTTLQSYDFTGNTPTGTPPSPTSIYNYTTSSNCLGSGYTSTGAAPGGSDQFDHDFGIAFASGGGGQDTAGATKIAVYVTGSGCRVLDLSTDAVTGDFGPTGTISGTPCLSTWHNAKMFKIGGAQGAIRITPTGVTCGGVPWIWNYAASSLTGSFYADCVTYCGGHDANGLLLTTANGGNGLPRFITICSITGGCPTQTGITQNLPSGGIQAGMDQHFAWNVLNDSWPFISSTFVPSAATPTKAWAFEVLGWQPTLGSNPYRFASTYADSRSSEFQIAEAIGAASQDGKWFLFGTNWLGTFGSVTGTAACVIGGSPECRGDVIAVSLQ